MTTSLFEAPVYWQHLGTAPSRPFQPFPWQAEAWTRIRTPWGGILPDGSPSPFFYALNCGRRAGKTRLAEKIVWKGIMAEDDLVGPPVVRVTADTENHGRKIWNEFIRHIETTPLSALVEDYSREQQLVTFLNGANAQLLSANNPSALAGDGVTLWVIDEAQYLKREAWANLVPSTVDRNGIIVAIGVSEGEGPFAQMCRRGDSPNWPEYERFVYPTSSNPLISPYRLESIRRTTPEPEYKRLYLCMWDEETGHVFHGVDNIITPGLIIREKVSTVPFYYVEPYLPGHDYYGGLDLGRAKDYSVYSIWNRQGRLVAWQRSSQKSWTLQEAGWKALSAAYHNPLTVVDSTGVGDAVIEALGRSNMRVEGFQISSNARKRALIDDFAIKVASKYVEIPEIPDLVQELKIYESKRSQTEGSSVIIYTAPSGEHDDWVISAALGTLKLPRPIERDLDTAEFRDASERQQGAWELIA